MAAELIGRCKCPLCGSGKAKLTLAKSGLPVLTCNGCNTQMFARSDRSDELMRAHIVKDAEPLPAPTAAPAREPAPAPVPAPPKPAPAPTPKPAPGEALSWGVDSWN